MMYHVCHDIPHYIAVFSWLLLYPKGALEPRGFHDPVMTSRKCQQDLDGQHDAP